MTWALWERPACRRRFGWCWHLAERGGCEHPYQVLSKHGREGVFECRRPNASVVPERGRGAVDVGCMIS